jgi:hypothetical protein
MEFSSESRCLVRAFSLIRHTEAWRLLAKTVGHLHGIMVYTTPAGCREITGERP